MAPWHSFSYIVYQKSDSKLGGKSVGENGMAMDLQGSCAICSHGFSRMHQRWSQYALQISFSERDEFLRLHRLLLRLRFSFHSTCSSLSSPSVICLFDSFDWLILSLIQPRNWSVFSLYFELSTTVPSSPKLPLLFYICLLALIGYSIEFGSVICLIDSSDINLDTVWIGSYAGS